MKMKDRIKQLEEKVDWLIKNGNYEKTTIMCGYHWKEITEGKDV